ncbi:MAG: hypothetical protein ABH834_01390 [Candidatus Altiarchaeota archaeon]
MHELYLKSGGFSGKTFISVLVLALLSGSASAGEMEDLVPALQTVAAALGILLISVQALKYVTAESPDDRAEAKKGLIWIIVGLLVVAISANLVCGLYCNAIATTYASGSITCTISSGICLAV